MRTITEDDIIAARVHVALADARQQQSDFADALLAAPDLTPAMVREWLPDVALNVHWCACPVDDDAPHPALIACPSCGLPPMWTVKEAYRDAQ